jgi:hypothetical protein
VSYGLDVRHSRDVDSHQNHGDDDELASASGNANGGDLSRQKRAKINSLIYGNALSLKCEMRKGREERSDRAI